MLLANFNSFVSVTLSPFADVKLVLVLVMVAKVVFAEGLKLAIVLVFLVGVVPVVVKSLVVVMVVLMVVLVVVEAVVVVVLVVVVVVLVVVVEAVVVVPERNARKNGKVGWERWFNGVSVERG